MTKSKKKWSSGRTLRAMFEQPHIPIVQIGPDGRFLSVNPAYCALLGYSEKELVRMKVADVTHPDDYRKEEELTRQLSAGEISDYALEKRLITSRNQIVWGKMTAILVRGDAGKPSFVLAIVEEIGERKRSEEELHESEEKLRLLIEGTPDYAMLMLDPSNHIIYWNKGAERVFGWSADEALGKSGELIFTPEDRAKGQEKKEMTTAQREGFAPDRRWHLRKDGSRVWVDGVMRRLDFENGGLRGFAKIARDATEERNAQEAIRKAHDDLDKRVRQRTAQLWESNAVLQDEMAERKRLEHEILEISEREKRRIGQDLHDTLCQELAAAAFMLQSTAKRLEEKKVKEASAVGDAAQIVNANVGLARDMARGLVPVDLDAGGLGTALRELCFRLSGKIPCNLDLSRAVRIKDQTVSLNLYRVAQQAVDNAIKHAKASEITINLRRERDKIYLAVRDDGVGFSAEEANKGMGTHIMDYRAKLMGGTLTIESKRGKGTTVICRVPAKTPKSPGKKRKDSRGAKARGIAAVSRGGARKKGTQ